MTDRVEIGLDRVALLIKCLVVVAYGSLPLPASRAVCSPALQCFSNLHVSLLLRSTCRRVAPSLLPSDTQLNVSAGGVAGFVSAGELSGVSTNVEVNISGGTVDFLTAYRGSTVNISGGIVSKLGGGSFTAIAAGSAANVSGGTIGDGFVAARR